MRGVSCQLLVVSCLLLAGCRQETQETKSGQEPVVEERSTIIDSLITEPDSMSQLFDSMEMILKYGGEDVIVCVDLRSFDTTLYFDIRYATYNNFLDTILYANEMARATLETATALKNANQYLLKRGYAIKVWDAYRPEEAQQKMWDVLPDHLKGRGYVADPVKGSKHSKGAAVDVTLVTIEGDDVLMPTDFDDFSVKARAYRTIDIDPEAVKNRSLLQEAMLQAGFTTIKSEWWHFNGPDANE